MSRVDHLSQRFERHYLEPAEAAVASGRGGRARVQCLATHLSDGAPCWLSGALFRRARRLVPKLERSKVPVGTALGVFVRPHHAEAVVVRVWVGIAKVPHTHVQPTPACLSAATMDSLRRAVLAVARLYPVHWVVDPAHDVSVRVTDVVGQPLEVSAPIRGGSLALAGAVATWSALSGLAPPHVVWTGSLGLTPSGGPPHTPILDVGDIGLKAAEARRAGAGVVVPSGCAAEAGDGAEGVCTLLQAIERAFGGDALRDARPPPRFDAGVALERLDLDYQRNGSGASWDTLQHRFERLAQPELGLGVEERVLAWSRAGACASHLGRATAAVRTLQNALVLAETADRSRLDAGIEARALTHLGVALRDLYRFDEAEVVLRRGVDVARQHRHTVDAVNAESTLGQLLVATGRARAGLPLVQRARDFYVGRHSYQSPRNHTYVVLALTRLGDLDAAKQEHLDGCRHNQAWAESAQVRTNRAYLDLALLGGHLRMLRGESLHSDGWHDLHRAALTARAAFSDVGWPGPGLQRVLDAAALRARPGERASVLDAVRRRVAAARAAPVPSPLFTWILAQTLLDVAMVVDTVEMALELVDEAERCLPTPRAEIWFHTYFAAVRRQTSETGLRRDLGRLLAATQY